MKASDLVAEWKAVADREGIPWAPFEQALDTMAAAQSSGAQSPQSEAKPSASALPPDEQKNQLDLAELKAQIALVIHADGDRGQVSSIFHGMSWAEIVAGADAGERGLGYGEIREALATADAILALPSVSRLLSELERARAERDEAQREAMEASPYCTICGSCGSDGCGCEHKCIYSTSHPDAIAEREALEADLSRALEALRKLTLFRNHGEDPVAYAELILAAAQTTEAELLHEDLGRLSRLFNERADLRDDRDRRINERLKLMIARASDLYTTLSKGGGNG